jgi:hypothetical protein
MPTSPSASSCRAASSASNPTCATSPYLGVTEPQTLFRLLGLEMPAALFERFAALLAA